MRFSTAPGVAPSDINPQELREFGKAACQVSDCIDGKCEHDDPLDCISQVWEAPDAANWVREEKARLGIEFLNYGGRCF